MKAVQITEYGGPEQIKIVDIETPTVGEGQVLIAVKAASLNPFDTMIRSGAYKEAIPLDLPKTLGGDIAGEITEVGAEVSDFQVGDAVYGQANTVAGNSGALAEFAVTKSNQIAKAPNNVSMEEAASLPLVGVSALQALTEHIGLHAGQRIFIHGGSGGIGAIAIQIAKHLGAYVATTANGEGRDYVMSLGADEVIDYQSNNFWDQLNDFDAAFDTVGGEDFEKTLLILKQGGIAVSMIAQADESAALEKGVTALTQSTQVTKERLEELIELIEQGVIKPTIAQTFPLSEIQAAFEARESGGLIGKIVIRIDN